MAKAPYFSFTIAVTRARPVFSTAMHHIHRCPDGPHMTSDCNANPNYVTVVPDIDVQQYKTKEELIAHLTTRASKLWDRWVEANRE